MWLRIDTKSPVPVYYQIAEAIRYRIATAQLRPEECLPSVREAAAAWGVNLHTVRRAYHELAQEGLIEMRSSRAARVLGMSQTVRNRGGKLQAFVSRTLREAHAEHGLSAEELAGLLSNQTAAPHKRGRPRVVVVECSEAQAIGHAEELWRHWEVDVTPWSLARDGEPPPGPLIATYFHYNDIRRRWPDRLHAIRFAGIQPDPGLARRVHERHEGRGRRRRTIYLCEFDRSMALNMAADLSVILPSERYRIVPRMVTRAGELLESARLQTKILFSPRVWGALTEAQREDGRAIEVRYVFEPRELEAIGRHFGWSRARRTT